MPATDLGMVVASPLRGPYLTAAEASHPSEFPGEGIASYDRRSHRLRSVIVEADVNRYLELPNVELALRAVTTPQSPYWRLDLGGAGIEVELEFPELIAGLRLGELVVRTRNGPDERLIACGVGPSRQPTCVSMALRSRSSSFRIEIESDGLTTVVGWAGTSPVHERFVLVFP